MNDRRKDGVERLRTFDEWQALGARIRKGEKSEARNAKGQPLFSSEQVWYPQEHDDRDDTDEDTFTRLARD